MEIQGTSVDGGKVRAISRFCYALDLVDDAQLIAEYEDRHRPGAVWPKVLQDLRDRGFVEMTIWRVGPSLFMICDVWGLEPPLASTDPDVAAWELEMDRYQQRLPGHFTEKWVPMQRIFSLTGRDR